MKHEFQPATAPTRYHQHQFEEAQPRLERLHFAEAPVELAHEQLSNFYNQQHYLTIEDIKSTRNSCWLCGCNWLEDHVSLDCPECGGYALSRPCPNCEGKCQQTWTRNITATHDRHRALWVGQCKLQAAGLSEAERFKAAAQAAASLISSNRQMIFSPAAAAAAGKPTYQTAKAGAASTSPIAAAINSTSSCCSSQPSSAASSDEEPDELSPK